jgi:hypothetical protein
MVTGYCVKCKQKGVDLTDAKMHITKRGGYMAKGKHEKCGTTVCAMMSKANAEIAMKNGVPKVVAEEAMEKSMPKAA